MTCQNDSNNFEDFTLNSTFNLYYELMDYDSYNEESLYFIRICHAPSYP